MFEVFLDCKFRVDKVRFEGKDIYFAECACISLACISSGLSVGETNHRFQHARAIDLQKK